MWKQLMHSITTKHWPLTDARPAISGEDWGRTRAILVETCIVLLKLELRVKLQPLGAKQEHLNKRANQGFGRDVEREHRAA
jgi:hypothetical protein